MSTQLAVPTPPAFKSLSLEQLKERVENAPGDVIEGFLPEKSLVLFAGDSGLGKTPLLIQMCLCVAQGIPFLGQRVRPGPNKVLHVDFENGESGLVTVTENLKEHLKLDKTPEGFRFLSFPASQAEVEREIKLFKPILVTIDALRGLNPKAEGKNSDMGEWLTKLHKFAIDNNTTIVLLHHLRKTDRHEPPEELVTAPLMSWLQDVAGARSLVNQTDVRIGVEGYVNGETELILKGHYKLRGQFGPWHIARAYDTESEAIGYRRLRGVELLTKEYKDAFDKLPPEFKYKDAEKALGKTGRPVTTFLGSTQAAGVLEKYGQRRHAGYRKVKVADSESAMSPHAAKIIAYCSNREENNLHRELDFQAVTGLKGTPLKEIINKLQKDGWLKPDPRCKGCYFFVNKNVVDLKDEPSTEASE